MRCNNLRRYRAFLGRSHFPHNLLLVFIAWYQFYCWFKAVNTYKISIKFERAPGVSDPYVCRVHEYLFKLFYNVIAIRAITTCTLRRKKNFLKTNLTEHSSILTKATNMYGQYSVWYTSSRFYNFFVVANELLRSTVKIKRFN